MQDNLSNSSLNNPGMHAVKVYPHVFLKIKHNKEMRNKSEYQIRMFYSLYNKNEE